MLPVSDGVEYCMYGKNKSSVKSVWYEFGVIHEDTGEEDVLVVEVVQAHF